MLIHGLYRRELTSLGRSSDLANPECAAVNR